MLAWVNNAWKEIQGGLICLHPSCQLYHRHLIKGPALKKKAFRAQKAQFLIIWLVTILIVPSAHLNKVLFYIDYFFWFKMSLSLLVNLLQDYKKVTVKRLLMCFGWMVSHIIVITNADGDKRLLTSDSTKDIRIQKPEFNELTQGFFFSSTLSIVATNSLTACGTRTQSRSLI